MISNHERGRDIDLLVLGAGMAGLAAAARAAQAGASVVLVDKAPAAGGSALYAGFIWTAPTVEVMGEVNPGGDTALAARLVEGYPAAIDWVRSLAVEVGEPVTVLGYGSGRKTDMPQLLAGCERIVRDTPGCEIMLATQTRRLLFDDGRVSGAEVVSSLGERRAINARFTLLATGGFGGDPELRERHIHRLAGDLPLRANPYSTGDGLRLGLSAGAAFGKDGAGFYGHLVPLGVAAKDVHELWESTFYHSEHGVLLNLAGVRFVDETVGDHLNTLAVLDQPQARALFVCDQRVHDEWMLRPYVAGAEPIDAFKLAYRRGARCAVADDLDEFEYLPEEWGYPGPLVRQALEEFNAACEGGRLCPARALDPAPLVDPPYYITELVPAITFTFGGVLIDRQARALDGF
ncbi:MAG TPA: FAD-dependent oxidoreductase, partial [Solirubrobacteraceae bacterium]|nr:FAD-dependent oxidoreductase [Solirubrobacteraceae bacterium]